MQKAAFLLLLIALMIVPTVISAQEDGLASDAPPTNATVNLGSDGWLDPFIISVSSATDDAGDLVDSATVDESCAGFVPSAPNVVVNWQPADEVPILRMFFLGSFDPVLMVAKPDGTYVCNDDFSPLVTNPLVDITDPQAGEYRVYVGTSREAAPTAPGFLVMTAGPHSPDTFDLSRLASSLAQRPQIQRLPLGVLLLRQALADNATTALTEGFEPVTADVTGGGSLPAFNINFGNPTCTGFISVLPNYAFTYAGSPATARVFFEGDSDSTLIVISQDGRIYCSDDESADNLNPAVDVPLTDGRYVVYVGSSDPTTDVSGSLTVTGDVTAEPAALAPADQTP